MYKINRTFDCPSFEGLYDFCELAVGGSLDAADLIITGEAQHAINWSGGYHHAKKSEASGFCYVNDIVVCIIYNFLSEDDSGHKECGIGAQQHHLNM